MIQTSVTSNIFCVPVALAGLLSTTVDAAELLIQEELGNVPIRGVFYPIILKILRRHGFSYKETTRTTLQGTYLFCFHGHVGIFKEGKYFDNQYPEGIQGPRLTVLQIFEVFPEMTK